MNLIERRLLNLSIDKKRDLYSIGLFLGSPHLCGKDYLDVVSMFSYLEVHPHLRGKDGPAKVKIAVDEGSPPHVWERPQNIPL